MALLGIISQLRLWKTIRQRRRDGAKVREEEKRKHEEAELEAGRQLEETNARERMEWEARYGGNSHAQHLEEVKSMSIQELPAEEGESDDEKSIDLEAVEGVESVVVSERSYRCEDCKTREANGEDAYVASQTPDDKHRNEGELEPTSDQAPENETQLPLFNGAAAAREAEDDDDQSAVSAVVGSETETMRSERFSGASFVRRRSGQSKLRLSSRAQQGFVQTGDDAGLASNSSAEGVVDEDSILESRRSSMVSADERQHVQETEAIDNASSDSKEHHDKTPAAENITEQECTEPKAEEMQGMQDQSKEQELDKKQEFDDKAGQKSEQGSLEDGSVQNSGSPAEGTEREAAIAEQKQEASESQLEQQDHAAMPVLRGGYSEDEPGSPQEAEQRPSEEELSSASAVSDRDAETSAQISQKPSIDALKSPDSEPSQAEHHDGKPQSNPSTRSKSKYSDEHKQTSNANAEANPKKEKPTLNEDTVKDLPQRASRIIQSYRTNEWAKHLDDAENPEPPPIQPIEEEQPELPVETSGKEPAAPVNVQELLQTPLNAQPPPVVERKEPRSSNESHRRESHESQSRQTDVAHSTSRVDQSLDITSNANPRPLLHAAQPARPKEHDNGSKPPKWKGPPPLLAMREDLVRNRLSSTSLSVDPWLASRNNPRQSILSTSTLSPTQAIPEEGEDDLPLSQRRAMLQQQQPTQLPIQSPRATSVPTNFPGPKPGQKDNNSSNDNNNNDNNKNNAQAIMAAWRNSVREDLRGMRDPLGTRGLGTNSAILAERTSSSSLPTEQFGFGQSSQDRSSAVNLHIENVIAQGMQRRDMNDLHREAMRRLQASATRRAE